MHSAACQPRCIGWNIAVMLNLHRCADRVGDGVRAQVGRIESGPRTPALPAPLSHVSPSLPLYAPFHLKLPIVIGTMISYPHRSASYPQPLERTGWCLGAAVFQTGYGCIGYIAFGAPGGYTRFCTIVVRLQFYPGGIGAEVWPMARCPDTSRCTPMRAYVL